MERRSVLIGAGSAAVAVGGTAVAWRLAAGSPSAYAQYADRLREPLPERAEIEDLIRYATLAANSHNTQPWRFIASADAIDILPDLTRATPAVDPDNHHLFISLGCAMENLVVAATASGRPGPVSVREDGSQRYAFSRATPRPDALLQAIAQRQSTRAAYGGTPVAVQDIEALQRAAAAPGVHAAILTERAQINRVRDLVVAGNDAQLADAAFMAELKAWLRFSPRSAMATGDGLYAPASGNPAMPEALGGHAFDLFFTPSAEREKYAHWVAVGRAFQRFALTATSLGLKHAHINQPVEVASLRPQLASLLGLPNLSPDLVVRFGHGPTLPFSPRRPMSSVMQMGARGPVT